MRQRRECVEHALEVRGVSLRFGGVRALTEVSFGVNDGELFSIIGPNGAGKTSIVNCISGRYKPTEGQLFYHGRDITGLNPNARPSLGIGRTFQNLALFHHMSVLDNIMVGRHHLLKNNFITGALYWLTGARAEELEHRRKVEEIIDFLDLQSVRKATAGTLPYGLRKRVELARAMALAPRLMLLLSCCASTPANTAAKSRCAKRISGSGACSPGTTIRRGCTTLHSAWSNSGSVMATSLASSATTGRTGFRRKSPPTPSAP